MLNFIKASNSKKTSSQKNQIKRISFKSNNLSFQDIVGPFFKSSDVQSDCKKKKKIIKFSIRYKIKSCFFKSMILIVAQSLLVYFSTSINSEILKNKHTIFSYFIRNSEKIAFWKSATQLWVTQNFTKKNYQIPI